MNESSFDPRPMVTVLHYRETPVDSVTWDGVRYDLVYSAEGYRVKHDGFVDWPIVVNRQHPTLRWSVYAFNGVGSSPSPNETLPDVVKAMVAKYLEFPSW